ncbi:hypothetical protein JCGZ_16595 [Jatropha curcas]|uniref:Pollen Ole e 1 allergen and extensin family protein n=1 Tax=Jatropha curcas TaxID=180498 RepID=A0A067JZ40_JATCU|nr:pistil-specific extensin-like protein [Jatropha curcas]KDP29206.1 hypothetical protein JCGZ_16595 [Jatropha curcas]
MGAMAMTLVVATLLVLLGTNSAMAWDGAGVIHVSGKVMCQDCTKGYNEWVNGYRPIKGCKVSLTCMDDRRRVRHYVSDTTDEQGQFDMTVSKYINGKKLNEKLCSVRLLSSPDPTCNVLTDFAGGKSGIKLRRPTFLYRDMVKYILNPFYFTTPMCEQPDTSESDGSNGSNHY